MRVCRVVHRTLPKSKLHVKNSRTAVRRVGISQKVFGSNGAGARAAEPC